MEALVSIVVPVYNAERYILACAHALQRQDYQNLEIILVDDGSTDASPVICDRLAGEDSRIQVIHKKNGGVSSARNAGIEVASGSYLMFADSDDLPEKAWVSRMVALFERWNVELVICSFRTANSFQEAQMPINNESVTELVHALDRKRFLDALGYMIACRATMFAPWNKLFSLDIIKKNNIRFEQGVNYGEDFLFNLQYLQYCNGIIETEEKLYNYIMQNTESLEAKYKPDLFENQTKLYMTAKNFMINNQIYEGKNIRYLDLYYASHILQCIENQNNPQNKKSILEREQDVAGYFNLKEAVEAVFNADLDGNLMQKKFTELVKAGRYQEIYEAITSSGDNIENDLNYVRYKVVEMVPGGIRWIPYTFASVKKYGLIITVKRIFGKVCRKIWR
ncbi:MAG: glycosyltransferase family 2 protein [Lachnospirales bacterium]